MTTWAHSRKGLITGEIIREDDTWAVVRLTGDHQIRVYSNGGGYEAWADGEEITVRKSHLTEVSGS